MGASQPMEKASCGVRCPVCGFSQADLKKTGRFGCGNCCDAFSQVLEPLLKSKYKGLEHKGKVPARLVKARQRTEDLRKLQRDLRKAVADEKYETAAELRDKIKHLEAEVAE